MKITTAVLTLLALAATQVNAAGAVIDTTLSGLPLTVAKRLDRAVAGAPATLGDRTTGVPMREAKMQLAPSSTAGKSGGSTAIDPSGVPLTTAKRR